jgi:hypothetical protein
MRVFRARLMAGGRRASPHRSIASCDTGDCRRIARLHSRKIKSAIDFLKVPADWRLIAEIASDLQSFLPMVETAKISKG